MAKFIVCDFHGTERRNNAPVNLDMVQYIEISPTGTNIEFNFQGTDRALWEFVNMETRDLEYNRIIDIATADE